MCKWALQPRGGAVSSSHQRPGILLCFIQNSWNHQSNRSLGNSTLVRLSTLSLLSLSVALGSFGSYRRRKIFKNHLTHVVSCFLKPRRLCDFGDGCQRWNNPRLVLSWVLAQSYFLFVETVCVVWMCRQDVVRLIVSRCAGRRRVQDRFDAVM